jgi:hypothetical protein
MFMSKSGLKELFQASKTGVGSPVEVAVKQMASAIAVREDLKSKNVFIKCPCNICSGSIEFPLEGLGQTIACPHCAMETVLFRCDS